ncbi:centromere protein L [Corapipo altera]|uniref:centromere protein L n=1 Tax=Corapipo altera TaxID=415028 RepID=UPI000FD6473C|nr:centromere protein L [Corapipo altera]
MAAGARPARAGADGRRVRTAAAAMAAESAEDGAARTLPSLGHLSRGLPFGRAYGRLGNSPSGRLILPAPLSQESGDPQRTALLLRKAWTLYSVTPLYRFCRGRLRDYARLLGAFIAAERQKGLAVEVGVELDIKVALSNLPELQGSEQDQPAVLVQLSSRSQASPKNSEDKILWSGCFCCVYGDDLSENIPEDFTCLPLFLANGAESYMSLVGNWFQKTFDCVFRRLAISPFSLTWMVAMWTGCKVDKATSAVELVFSVPRLPQPLDISYAIHPEDAKALWDTIQKTPGEITQEEVDVFMDCLYSHFHRHFKIHLSATKLVKVSTAIASAHCDGVVKMLHSQYLSGVLMLLTELAISQIQ